MLVAFRMRQRVLVLPNEGDKGKRTCPEVKALAVAVGPDFALSGTRPQKKQVSAVSITAAVHRIILTELLNIISIDFSCSIFIPEAARCHGRQFEP